MYTVFTSPGSGGFAAEAMLEAGSAKWQREIVDTSKDQHKSASYLAMNPAGQVPALKLPDGTVMTESAAICLYLGDAHPETGLAPDISSPARPHYLRWMVYLPAVVYEADLRYFYCERYTADPAGAAGVKACAATQMSKAFAILDKRLGEAKWLAGDRTSAADIYMTMLASWHPDAAAMKKTCKNVARVWDAVADLDYVKKTNEIHKLW